MLSPLCELKALVTLDLSRIGCINTPTEPSRYTYTIPALRFCEERWNNPEGQNFMDSRLDNRWTGRLPLLLHLGRINSSAKCLFAPPNLVALDIRECFGLSNDFMEPVLTAAAGEESSVRYGQKQRSSMAQHMISHAMYAKK